VNGKLFELGPLLSFGTVLNFRAKEEEEILYKSMLVQYSFYSLSWELIVNLTATHTRSLFELS